MSSNGYLAHYGTKKHSGRYPWGSGERPYQSGGGPSKKQTVVATNSRGEKKTVTIRKQKKASDNIRATARKVYDTRDEYTNQELKEIIERLGYEQKLIDLSKKKKSIGQKWVEDVLTDSSKKIATNALTGISDKMLKELIGIESEGGKSKKKKK